MSLHINMTDDAEEKLRTQKRKGIFTASFTAILSGGLIIMLLYIFTVFIPSMQDTSKPVEVYYPTEEPTVVENQKRPMDHLKKPTPAPAPDKVSPINLLTVVTPSPTPVQTTDLDTSETRVSNIAGLDDGIPFMQGSDREGIVTEPIGQESGDLEGTFYDFKQTQSGTPTNITPDEAANLMKEFVTKKWNPGIFNKYYKAPTKLYSSMFYISRRKAIEAPKAYKCEDRVKDSRWCAVYRGKVRAPKSGKFRFVGAGDDSIAVRFNNELVFDYGWYILSIGQRIHGGKDSPWYNTLTGKRIDKDKKKELVETGINIPPVTFYEYSGTKHWNDNIGGLAAGKVFEVKAGETYPIEVLITEIPGGEFGVALLIEDMDSPPTKKDAKTGAPIFPLFRTAYQLPAASIIKGMGGDYVPFDQVGPVWESVK